MHICNAFHYNMEHVTIGLALGNTYSITVMLMNWPEQPPWNGNVLLSCWLAVQLKWKGELGLHNSQSVKLEPDSFTATRILLASLWDWSKQGESPTAFFSLPLLMLLAWRHRRRFYAQTEEANEGRREIRGTVMRTGCVKKMMEPAPVLTQHTNTAHEKCSKK